MNALLLTQAYGEKVLFNWDNIVAVSSNRMTQTQSTVRVRGGSLYDVKETLEDIMGLVKGSDL